MVRYPLTVLAVLIALAALLIALTTDRLPERVATHFGFDNAANAWMSRDVYQLFMLAFAVFFPLLIVGLVAGLPRLFPNQVNIPNKSYWLAPERRAESLEFLSAHGFRLGWLIVALSASLHLVILRANALVPPKLPGTAFVTVLAATLVGIAAWIFALYARFRKTP
jgi:serine/threonine-protein kinase